MLSKESTRLLTSVIAFITVVAAIGAHLFGIDAGGISLLSFSPSVTLHDPSAASQASLSGYGSSALSAPPSANAPPRALMSPAADPSFDCNVDIRHWAERAVCASPELAAYDRQLDSLYTSTRNSAAKEMRESLREAQRAWIAKRNACEAVVDGIGCLRNVYLGRIAELSGKNQTGGAPFANDSLTVQEPSQPLTPPTVIDRIPPEYPLAARLQRQEGFVLVEFTVAKDGTVSNPTVLGANPQGIFDEAALQAVHQWRYQPTVIGGVPVERPGMRVEIDFKLNG